MSAVIVQDKKGNILRDVAMLPSQDQRHSPVSIKMHGVVLETISARYHKLLGDRSKKGVCGVIRDGRETS